jgi:hypothetical protein
VSASTSSLRRLPVTRTQRAVIYCVCGLLWVSGVFWLVLHYEFQGHNEFGDLPNPAEPVLMRLHGLLAVAGVFLCGWLTAAHVTPRWSIGRNRTSGLVLAGCALVLVVSGYALYYTTAGPHTQASVLHQVLGVLTLAAALTHWLRNRDLP